MKIWAASAWAISLLTLVSLVRAQSQQSLQDAQAALERKDYTAALRLLQPLAAV